MTTPNTDLVEQMWEAIAEVRDQHPRVFNDAPTDDVVAAVLPILRAAQAEAWDEGENAGFLHGRWDEYTINPYRYEQED